MGLGVALLCLVVACDAELPRRSGAAVGPGPLQMNGLNCVSLSALKCRPWQVARQKHPSFCRHRLP